jgi:signal transduction histidine kinase
MQKRILLLVVVCIVIVLVSIGVVSQMSVDQSIQHSLDTHLMLATFISTNIDSILERNITRLNDISTLGLIDLEDGNWDYERKALAFAYEYSIFTDGLFMTDLDGNVVTTYPHREGGYVNLLSLSSVVEALTKQRTVVSDIYTFPNTDRRVIFVLVPLKNLSGETMGLVGGEINPTNYLFSTSLKSISRDGRMLIEMVDSHGTVISSNHPERMLTHADHNKFLSDLIRDRRNFVGTCHRCHTDTGTGQSREADMLSFASLSFAPWGISVRDPQSVVFAPSTSLKKSFLVISLILIAASVLLAIGLSKSIVKPLRTLTAATKKIAGGDLSEPIAVPRHDETGVLAKSFDIMREKLAESLESISSYNLELEHRVEERTREIEERKQQLATLLDEGMRSQEEERRRISRELHDETSQTLAALGMALDIAMMALREGALTEEMLGEIRTRLTGLVDGIHRIIQDLRPPVLDDLGLESAVNWLCERHLAGQGIDYSLSAESLSYVPIDKRSELRLFRVFQEAIMNIVRHSEASYACLNTTLTRSALVVTIVDTGVGFNVREALGSTGKKGLTGYGLLGMGERVKQLRGDIVVDSYLGEGTHISINIPRENLGQAYA